MSVLFLDIDGVLNTVRWEKFCLSGEATIEDEYGITFDRTSIANLKEIIDLTDASIVIHSTWKLLYDVKWIAKMWSSRDLPGIILDVTPNMPPYYSKQDEITMWLKHHPEIQNYAILDDEHEFDGFLLEHHVLIDGENGITGTHVQKAVHILSTR